MHIDWKRLTELIMKYYKEDLSDFNNEITVYNLKNYLEILPVIDILHTRNPAEVY